MPVSVLVATPHAAFGELLRISLEDSGQYLVRLVQSAKETRAAARRASFPLVILDSALADEPFVPLCYELFEQLPGLRLIIIPPDNNPNHPSLGGLIPHGYLSRPFYLPDLLDTASRLLADRDRQMHAQSAADSEATPASAPSLTLPAWLQEPLTLRGYLEKELANTQALAAMAGLNGATPGSGTLRASAGALDDDAAQELATTIFRYWNRAEKTDLMRFVRVSGGKADYLIYATQVSGDLVLILVFDTSAPLSQIRPQTKTMAQALATLPPADYQAGRKMASPLLFSASDQPVREGAGSNPGASVPATQEPHTQPLDDTTATAGPGSQPTPIKESSTGSDVPSGEEEDGEEEDDGEAINLAALLGSVPSPDPDGDRRQSGIFSGSWASERSASAPIPTLPGGLNGWEQEEKEHRPQPQPMEQQPPVSRPLGSGPAATEPPGTDGNLGLPAASPPAESLPAASQQAESQQTGDQASGSSAEYAHDPKLPPTAPLDPDRLFHSPHSASLPVDFALPASPPAPKFPVRSGGAANGGRRPASAEVNTEPPVKPAALSTPIPASGLANLENASEPPINPLDDTRPRVLAAINNLDQLEPASPALSLLNYTCVLVPRLPQHYLTGELADRLALWVQQLCLAFGWRLEGISIRPEYLQWTVQVAPAISPGNLVKVVRQRTSLHIFANYQHLADQNPSGDFWATGYLIVSGAQPPSAQLLRDYIAQTRKRQGIIK
jgi:REP element-mobilizing transposase RayT/DNA-binding NarL/FixJ family response regulator